MSVLLYVSLSLWLSVGLCQNSWLLFSHEICFCLLLSDCLYWFIIVCLTVCWSVFLTVCPSCCLSVYRLVCLSLCLNSWILHVETSILSLVAKIVRFSYLHFNVMENRRIIMETVPKAWTPCQGHGDRAKGMETEPKAWRPSQRHRDHAKGMETMPKAWRLCQRHENHAKGMKIMPKT